MRRKFIIVSQKNLNDYFDTCDAVLEKGKNTQDIDAHHEAQQVAQDPGTDL